MTRFIRRPLSRVADNRKEVEPTAGGADRMPWRFFLGAAFLTAALLEPYAGVGAVARGVALAAAIQWLWRRVSRRSE